MIRALAPGIVFSSRSDSHLVGVPEGVDGGLDGRRARLVRNHGRPDAVEMFSKTANIQLERGESVRLETPGGGGCGEPAERSRDRLRDDLLDGRVSDAAARRDYGAPPA